VCLGVPAAPLTAITKWGDVSDDVRLRITSTAARRVLFMTMATDGAHRAADHQCTI
jgi:hypothetical protein